MVEEMVFEAKIDNLHRLNSFVLKGLNFLGCDCSTKNQILLSCEEIFSNVCNYAYKNEIGFVTVSFSINFDRKLIKITFSDHGIPYNPLDREDPDINASAEDRVIGGLGIFIVKNIMDKIYYEFKDNKNFLTMEKELLSNL